MATSDSDSDSIPIAEKVRFWEEQDKINQELIPRVIRQNELLTQHIADHENLPEVAGNAIGQALAGAREEQRQQYEATLDAAKAELNKQAQATLNQSLATLREEQRQQYEAALDAAKAELAEQTQANLQKALDDFQTALTDAKAGLSEQTQTSIAQASEQLQTAMGAYKTELNEQSQASLNQGLATLREESRKIRNLLIGITSGAGAIGIATLIVSILT